MRFRTKFIVSVMLSGTLFLSACKLEEKVLEKVPDEIDFDKRLTREDFKALAPNDSHEAMKKKELLSKGAPPVPKVSQILAAPRPPKRAQEQVVSISVTEDIPLKDVFVELARLANIDLELDPSVAGGIIFRAKNKPLEDVVERIAKQAGLRYSFDNGVLKVQRDTPYLKSYGLDFLNIDRASSGNVRVNTNVLSAGGDGGGESLNTGSSAEVSSSYESDLWKQFESAIDNILQNTKEVPTTGAAASDGTAEGSVATAQAAAASDGDNKNKSFYVLNKEGGLLTLYGTDSQQEKVLGFIEALSKKASAQVLIEAKIVEVTLDDQYSSGINWSSFKPGTLNFDFAVDALDATGSVFSLSGKNKDTNALDAVLNLTQKFGTTRTLSSPRIHAINNQQAVFTFAENKVYFELSIERETDTNSSTNQELFTVDSQIKTVPIGIILVVQPSINPDTNQITMNMRPTLSRVVEFIPDPSVAFLASQVASSNSSAILENLIPVVEVREMDTVMKINSGDVIIMGGLMEERNTNTDYGVPGLSNIPVLGNLFKNVDKQQEVVEMVIFVKASVIKSKTPIGPKDIEIYRKFTSDPRPLTF